MPAFEAVRQAWRPSDAVLRDRHGEVLDAVRVDPTARRGRWVPLEAVSRPVVDAVVRAEDRRFATHGGVDWRALGDAAVDTVLRGSPRGASTLTMQVAAMLDPVLAAQGGRRTVAQKFDQIRAARALEAAWTKDRILEAYLNLATFRGDRIGIGAAAEGLFGRRPADLDTHHAAVLAALLRGPNAAPAVVARRACALAPADACAAITRLAMTPGPGDVDRVAAAGIAPHVARQLLSADARDVWSTIDAAVQRHATDVLRQQVSALADRGVRDGAVVVIDNATGAVRAYVGNTGADASARWVDGVRAPRQAGSTLKPFLYAQAIDARWLTAAALLDDAPLRIPTAAGVYAPENYDHGFRGPVSVRTALASSLNVPAVRTLQWVTPERFAEQLRALGFAGVEEGGDWYGTSLALGTADVTLWQLANAYRAIANGGHWSPAHLLPGPPPREQSVMSREAAFVVTDILTDAAARSAAFGLDSVLATRVPTAVKTGTSKDMRDNWCVGFSRRWTVAVWVGNFDGAPMRDVSGTSGAAPVWAALIAFLHRDVPLEPFPAPDTVSRRRVRYDGGIEPERDEWFLRGTETERVRLKGTDTDTATITYPTPDAILAIDPDLPAAASKVRFAASGRQDGMRWRLDGRLWPFDGTDTPDPERGWTPVPGRHVLERVDATGTVLDAVRFEVRGTSPVR
ncbi:MAG: penicillin-binding protein 1C [Burkholderiales bacterium]|nr:penicillin-binding protein 1C [Burkholderiales bacterium]